MVSILTVGSTHAATIGLTLTSDKDPLKMSPGESITFSFGINPLQMITGYTLDVRYDTAELDFSSSAQRLAFFEGTLVPPFTLDPATTPGDPGSTGLVTSNSGRASVLQVSDSDPVGSLLNLTFTVLEPIADGLDDLTVGILEPAANDINPPVGGSAFTINPDVVTARIAPVSLPSALWLLVSSLLAIAGLSRIRRLQ